MNPIHRAGFGLTGVLALSLFAAGCEEGAQQTTLEDTPAQSAREALDVNPGGVEKTIETQRNVIVQDTTKVIDAETGKVIKTEETQTPVTITQEKTVERDVDIEAGQTVETVK